MPIDPLSTPLEELRLLRKAFQLLIDVEQLTSADESLIAEQVRNILTTGERQPAAPDAALPSVYPACYAESDTPPCAGFTVEERVCQVGYRLLLKQHVSLIPRLTLRVRLEWQRRFDGTPMQYQGEDWYGEEDRVWVDPLIHAYLGQFPALVRVPEGA